MAQLSSDVADEALKLLIDNMGLSSDERPEECTTLNSQLEEEVNKLELVLAAFQNHIKRRISQIHHNQNLLIPISRLPPELLSNIFLKAIDNLDARRKLNFTLAFSNVSSWWRSTCISTPRLWNTMFRLDSPEMTKLQLERSKKVPLHVICRNGTLGKEVEVGFFDIILPHMSRWKTVNIYSVHAAEIASIYLRNKYIPILEELGVSEMDYEDPDDPDPFMPVDLNISAPCLTDLSVTLNVFPLRLEYGLHSNLRSLSFTSCINGAPFLMEHYHILLSSAPHLKHISIYGEDDLISPPFQVDTAVDIQLYSLNWLSFSYNHWDVVIALASSIIIAPSNPRPCEVRARHLAPFPMITFPKDIRSNSVLSTICSSEWLKARNANEDEEDCLTICLGQDSTKELWSFQIECESEISMGILFGIITSGSFQRVRIVELEGCQLFRTGDLPWTNSSLPCVEVLRIRSLYTMNGEEEETTPVSMIIRKLSSPVSSPQRTFWICPKLRHISFDCSIEEDCLVQLLQARCRDADYVISSSNSLHRLELIEVGNFAEYGWTEEKSARLAVGYSVQIRCRDLSEW